MPLTAILLTIVMPLAYSLATEPAAFTLVASPTVCSKFAGCMRGIRMPGYRVDSFEAFMGIPFAMPPVGELRFSHPQPYPRWLGILDATQPKQDCIQKNVLFPKAEATGVEDCLYLNVYRPKPSIIQHKKMPVMVYMHGGGWFAGSANPGIVGPEYFMDTEEVILVTITYRVGAFGFLSTNDSVVPGNFGLKDQTLALKWVQKNIHAFGGDPEQVTIFGQSAGGASVHLHMLSKHSEGLFQAVISQSGTASLPIAYPSDPLAVARATAEYCNITNAQTMSSIELLQALRAVDANVLLEAADNFKYWDNHPLIVYGISVENEDSQDAFLTQHPLKMLANGNYKPVRFMAGVVPEEGGMRLPIWEFENLRNSFNKDFDNLLEKFMEFPAYLSRAQVDVAMKRIIDEYFEGKHELSKRGFIDVTGDRIFIHSFYHDTKMFANTVDTNKTPLQLYVFNFSGPYSYSTFYSGGSTHLDYGVVHCDELIYLFRSPFMFPDFPKNSTAALLSQALVRHFVNFAKNINTTPNPKCTKENYPIDAPDAICDYILFENGPLDSYVITTNNKFNVHRMRMWDEILQY